MADPIRQETLPSTFLKLTCWVEDGDTIEFTPLSDGCIEVAIDSPSEGEDVAAVVHLSSGSIDRLRKWLDV